MRIVVFVLGIFLLSNLCFGATINVPAEQPTIQAGIDAALDGDSVLVAPGLYTENINFNGKGIVVSSTAGRDSTIIEAGSQARPIVKFINGEDSASVLDGFYLRNTTSAPGIQCDNSSPIIQNNEISNCLSPDDGGGISCTNSGATIRGNKIHHNGVTSGRSGGGISIKDSHMDTLKIYENEIYENMGTNGPGIGAPIASNSQIFRNVIYGNTGEGIGAGIYYAGTDCNIYNNTVVGNSKGIYVYPGYGTNVDIRNNIIVNCPGGGLSPAHATYDYNDVWNNTSNNDPGANGITADPLFRDPTTNDYHLLPGSPCIDAGDPNRIYNDWYGTRCDIGTFPIAPNPSSYPLIIRINMGLEEMNSVVEHTPTFYWSFFPLSETEFQTDYELEVGVDNDWAAAEMWSTGQISSTDTFAVYSGIPLINDSTYYIRIRGSSELKWGAWAETNFRMKSRPQPPVPEYPLDQEIINQFVQITVTNSLYNDTFALNYEFLIYSDAELTTIFNSETGIAEQNASTTSGIFTEFIPDNIYWWRARSYDDYEYSEWSVTESFFLRNPIVIVVPTDQPTIQAGIDAAIDGDTVLVAVGVYNEQFSFKGKSIVVSSEAGPNFTKVLGSSINHSDYPTVSMTQGEGPNAVLQGFTLEGGPIAIRVAGNPTIKFNILTDQTLGNWAALVVDGQASIINNSICYGANGGIACYNSGAVILNNIIAYNQDYAVYNANESLELAYNNIIGGVFGVSIGPGSISSDPLFRDIALRNYNLIPGSPCIDAGHPGSIYYDPDGTRNDMGACPINQAIDYICGDAYDDQTLNVGDAVYLINFVFKGGPAPDPIEAGDANCDNLTNVGDAVYLINFVFKGGPQPCDACP